MFFARLVPVPRFFGKIAEFKGTRSAREAILAG
jgi:hypothetical protein